MFEIARSLRYGALSALLLGAHCAAPAASAELDLNRVVWTELRFKVSKLMFRATTEIKLERAPGGDVRADLIDPQKRQWIDPSDDRILFLSADSRILGRESKARLWLAGSDAAAFQRDELSRGRRYKVYRYADAGVYTETRRPAGGERGKPHARWSLVDARYSPYPVSLEAGQRVAGPLALLLAVSAAPLDEAGDTAELLVLSKGQLVDVELRVISRETLSLRYTEVSRAGTREVSGAVDVLRIGVRGRRTGARGGLGGAGLESADLELMGLKGDLEILLDEDSRIPLRISGRTPILGRVRLKLRRVRLR